MKFELTFDQMVEEGLLDRDVALRLKKLGKYAKRVPSDKPEGESRLYSLQEAMRFCVCCHLLKFGIPLQRAAWIASYAENLVSRLNAAANGRRTYASTENNPWVLRVMDSNYVQIWRDDGLATAFWRPDQAIDIYTKRPAPFVAAVTQVEVNLTALENRLAAAT